MKPPYSASGLSRQGMAEGRAVDQRGAAGTVPRGQDLKSMPPEVVDQDSLGVILVLHHPVWAFVMGPILS